MQCWQDPGPCVYFAGGKPQQGPAVTSRQTMARWAAGAMPAQRQKVQIHRSAVLCNSLQGALPDVSSSLVGFIKDLQLLGTL